MGRRRGGAGAASGTGCLNKHFPCSTPNGTPGKGSSFALPGVPSCFANFLEASVQREAASGAFLPDEVFAHFGLALHFVQRTKPQCAKEMLTTGKMPPLLYYEQYKFLLRQP
jgi:hypothetical protein